MTNFNVGDKVQLYPGDTQKKIAKILDCNNFGWEFEILEETSQYSFYKVGEVVFISNSTALTMKKL